MNYIKKKCSKIGTQKTKIQLYKSWIFYEKKQNGKILKKACRLWKNMLTYIYFIFKIEFFNSVVLKINKTKLNLSEVFKKLIYKFNLKKLQIKIELENEKL